MAEILVAPEDSSEACKNQIRVIANSERVTLESAPLGTTQSNVVLSLLPDLTAPGNGGHSPNEGTFSFTRGYTTFPDEPFINPVGSWGYNFGTDGRINTNEPAFGLNIEGRYWNGLYESDEFYAQHYTQDGISAVRPFFIACAVSDSDVATRGLVTSSHIYAGGFEGNGGLNIFGSKSGSNDTSLLLANIKRNQITIPWMDGVPGTVNWSAAIRTESVNNLAIYTDNADLTPTGAKAVFFAFDGEGGGLVLGGRSQTAAAFAAGYPIFGVDGRRGNTGRPVVAVRALTGGQFIHLEADDGTLLWDIQADGVLDLDGSVFGSAPADTVNPDAWLAVEKDGVPGRVPWHALL